MVHPVYSIISCLQKVQPTGYPLYPRQRPARGLLPPRQPHQRRMQQRHLGGPHAEWEWQHQLLLVGQRALRQRQQLEERRVGQQSGKKSNACLIPKKFFIDLVITYRVVNLVGQLDWFDNLILIHESRHSASRQLARPVL